MENLTRNLKEMSLEIESAGMTVCGNLKGDMSNDLLFMCKSFSERQLSQIKNLNLIADQDDAILIARSMFEGALYLCYSIKHKDMSRRWRLFSIVVDKQRMDVAESNGEHVPDEVKKTINEFSPEVDSLFKDKNGKYIKYWYGKKQIKEIAKDVGDDFIYLYDTYYSPMSEYHHWATSSFGKRYRIEDDSIVKTNSDEVNLERANAICMALSSILSTLKVSCELFKTQDIVEIQNLISKFRKISGLTTKEIKITRKIS